MDGISWGGFKRTTAGFEEYVARIEQFIDSL